MNKRTWIIIWCFVSGIVVSQAQYSYKKTSDYGLDHNVKKVVEVTCSFNFEKRKCEEIERTTLEFSNDGKLLSEAIQRKGKPIETITYFYDTQGRLKMIQSNEKIEFSYHHTGDTLLVKEIKMNNMKQYEYIYEKSKLDHLNLYKNSILICVEEYQYSNNEMIGKSVQFYSESGEKETYEEHRYRNGRTVFFRKRNSEKDSKTCYYYFNSYDNSLDFEETARPGVEAVISKDCNYELSNGYWINKSEERFSAPMNSLKISTKQKHLFYFRKIILKDGTKIGSVRVQKDFVDRFIE